MNRRIIRIVACLVLAAGLIGAGYLVEGYVQAIALVPASAFITIAVTDFLYIININFGQPVIVIRLMTVVLLFLVSLLIFETYVLVESRRVPAFPGDGLIADFQDGTGRPARTTFGTQCSMFSDSSFNLDSTITYRRVDDNFSGAGHLQIKFSLDGQGAGQPYVGIYCPFSFQPITIYDASRFKALKFDRALTVSPEKAHLTLGVAIFSAGTPPELRKMDAHPAYEIDGGDIHGGSQTVFFNEFHAPPFVKGSDELDAAHVFGIAFVVTGTPHSGIVSGSVDLDNIRFE